MRRILLISIIALFLASTVSAKDLNNAELVMLEALEELEQLGEIQGLRVGPVFRFRNLGVELDTKITFKGDFLFVSDGELVCLEVRNKIGPVFKLKQKLMKAFYPHVNFIIVRS